MSVQHWDLATGKARATFWTPVSPGGNHPDAGNVVGFYFAALSADGKTVAWGGAEGDDKTITGTAHLWEVASLATSPPEIPKELKEPAAKKTSPEQVNDAKDKAAADKEQADSTAPAKEEAQALQVLDGGQESLTLKGRTAPVNSVAFSPDGKRLASANTGKTVKVWDVTPRTGGKR